MADKQPCLSWQTTRLLVATVIIARLEFGRLDRFPSFRGFLIWYYPALNQRIASRRLHHANQWTAQPQAPHGPGRRRPGGLHRPRPRHRRRPRQPRRPRRRALSSSDPAKAKASAPDYDIKPERAYGSLQGDGRGRDRSCPPTSASTSSPSPRPTTRTSRSPRPSPRPASTSSATSR